VIFFLTYLNNFDYNHNSFDSQSKKESSMKEFTLKSVVDFLENGGFHVRMAEEVGKVGQTLSLGGKELVMENGAIRLEIAPKEEANP
jgi:hypothetical protein